MKGRRRLLGVLGLGGALLTFAACGSNAGGTTSIKFVGNSSCSSASPNVPYTPSPPNVNSEPPVGQAIDEMPHYHVPEGTQVQYNHDPPTSGCHYIVQGKAPLAPGLYSTELPAEYWVHNLEHGYVVVLFNCPQGCPNEVQQLAAWKKTLPADPAGQGRIPYAKIVIMPWHTMAKKFAAVSWDWYEGWNTFDLAGIEAFYNNHIGQSPENPLSQ